MFGIVWEPQNNGDIPPTLKGLQSRTEMAHKGRKNKTLACLILK